MPPAQPFPRSWLTSASRRQPCSGQPESGRSSPVAFGHRSSVVGKKLPREVLCLMAGVCGSHRREGLFVTVRPQSREAGRGQESSVDSRFLCRMRGSEACPRPGVWGSALGQGGVAGCSWQDLSWRFYVGPTEGCAVRVSSTSAGRDPRLSLGTHSAEPSLLGQHCPWPQGPPGRGRVCVSSQVACLQPHWEPVRCPQRRPSPQGL